MNRKKKRVSSLGHVKLVYILVILTRGSERARVVLFITKQNHTCCSVAARDG